MNAVQYVLARVVHDLSIMVQKIAGDKLSFVIFL